MAFLITGWEFLRFQWSSSPPPNTLQIISTPMKGQTSVGWRCLLFRVSIIRGSTVNLACMDTHPLHTHNLLYSSKSCRSEILFQGSVWCSAATVRGRLDFEGGVYKDRRARTYTTSIIMYARKMRARIRIFLSTPYHAVRFRGRYLLGRVGR